MSARIAAAATVPTIGMAAPRNGKSWRWPRRAAPVATVVSAPEAPANAAGTTPAANPALAGNVANAVHGGRRARGVLSHAGVTGNCASCHNGVLAAGKGAAHIASNNACQNCHTTLAWLPARFDHQGVTASLRELPQRRAGLGQAHAARANDPGLQRLSWHDRMDCGELQPRRAQRAVPQLPQRHQRHRQAGTACEHDTRLRQLPQYRELDRRGSAGAGAATRDTEPRELATNGSVK